MPRKPGEPLKYRQIADELRGRIDAGEFADGDKLPPERSLAEEYGVAPGTVRQALGVLRDEGVTESRVGSGVYIRRWRPIVRNALRRLSGEQWGEGKSIWDVDVENRRLEPVDVQIEQAPVSADVARTLDLEEGDLVWRRNRKYLVDGVPVIRSTSYIPEDLARGTRITQVDSGPGGTYARLREAGHGPVRFREELRCRMPSAAESEDLGLAAATPVVEICRTAYEVTGRVVEVNRMVLDASKYLLVYDFPA
ncbi:GntR family transcriptional regulator [Streptomyces spectabilis]|uniref:GntR family transcriptional regulator n=1 Tax=Streptomyces spectabilis TaxID=68270 RepID=A0A5P2X0Q2_STRST|nr:GntR family transcriptional regulator [Streptomyces spectabilis]MBB5108344.1 GntR family transcriptional regulator [Streptomyces spectabilis]MCI3901101.1 GntR family transcriptional regulator [Streptomyces spectabilis]QEV58593.1 GntR family transcriptional regulator [Streptomyces spectabilis]GGV45966.1 GntR family transcriptional regulator [Streptomyces spectabilis]